MATQSTYCTERDLKDIFPEVDSYDTKTPIYGWVVVDGAKYGSHDSGLVTQLFANGESLGPAQSAHTDLDVEGEWFYNSTDDVLYYYSSTNPNDKLMESGELFSTLTTRYMKNASEYLDSRLDGTLSRERLKDQDGNYDYIIVRTAALLSAIFLIRAHDPTSEVASAFWEEANGTIELINTGKTKLSHQTTVDDSKGTIREKGTITGALRIVDTRGRYYGVYDKIGVRITTGGAIGTAKYSVWTKSVDMIGSEIMDDSEGSSTTNSTVTDKVIDGGYQQLTGGLQIRFAGDTGDAATEGDAWEIEVTGRYEEVDNTSAKQILRTRGGRGVPIGEYKRTLSSSTFYPPSSPRPPLN
jgi:hypothetical protein